MFLILVAVFSANIWFIKGMYICRDARSIDINKLCDGRTDCPDGSDETTAMCFDLICAKDKFRCKYGGCIDKTGRCNGTADCRDGSDEAYCEENIQCGINESRCFFTQKCIEKKFTCDGVRNCDDGSDEDEDMCRDRRCPSGTFRCQQGGCIYEDLLCDNYPDCPDASDETEHPCARLKCQNQNNCSNPTYTEKLSCKPLTSGKLNVVCTSDTLGLVPCDEPIPIGTVAKLECKEHYIPIRGSNKAFCQADGNWNADILECKPECGVRHPGAEPLIFYGGNVTNWPWHAVMYALEKGKWTPFCGGTLISEDVVLTAAHCIWKKSPTHLKIAFSKYDADFDVTNAFTQVRGVSKVFSPPEYQDYRSNYGSDIAVVRLSESVELSDYVKPACLDWNLLHLYHFIGHNQTGTITGMGLTENNHPSKMLQSVELPVIPTEVCVKTHRSDFRKYITHTTFCAGWTNGTNVCNGDSGGGLLFKDVNNPSRWILQGLASVSARKQGSGDCDTSRYAIFTKVSLYVNWLKFDLKLDIF